MRIIMLMTMLFVASIVQANAQSATQFDYTGVQDVAWNGPTYFMQDNNYNLPGVLSIGSSQAQYSDALQFLINTPTNISSLNVDATIDAPLYSGGGTALFEYQIYSGTTNNIWGEAPDIQNLVAASGTGLTFSNVNQLDNIDVALNATLQPGTYWLAEEGYAIQTGGNGQLPDTQTTQTYNDPPIGVAPVPEPMSFYLLAIGLIAMFLSMKFKINRNMGMAAFVIMLIIGFSSYSFAGQKENLQISVQAAIQKKINDYISSTNTPTKETVTNVVLINDGGNDWIGMVTLQGTDAVGVIQCPIAVTSDDTHFIYQATEPDLLSEYLT